MSNGTGEVTISLEDWFAFLTRYTSVDTDAGFVFGKPEVRDDELVVPFAFDTDECHPRDWASGKPDWMTELEKKGS